MAISFDGYPCYDPTAFRESCLNASPQLPLDWYNKVNRFDCTDGTEPGTGAILMLRGDLELLDINQLHDLTFTDHFGKSVTLKSLMVAGPTICLDPTRTTEDKNTLHYVPIADVRHFFKLTAINAGYNLRITPTGNYAIETTGGSNVPYTWDNIWEALWEALDEDFAGDMPFLPSTPEGTPDNFAFFGMTVMDAIKIFLARCAFQLVLDPIGDKFYVVELGENQPQLDQSLTGLLPYRIWDIEPLAPSFGRVPSTVQVFFRKSPTRAYGNAPELSVSIDADSPVDGESGTVIIHDDLLANYSGTKLLNNVEIQSRAAERAETFFRERRQWYKDPLRKVYSGAHSVITPGQMIEAVSWYDLGRGTMTEIKRRPICDPVADWTGNKHQGWRLVEFVRVNADTESGAETPPSGYLSGRITVWSPDNGAWQPVAKCWWRGANGEVGVEDWRYQSRFKGFLQGRPVFVGGCCEGSEGGGGSVGGGGDEEDDEDDYIDEEYVDPTPTDPVTTSCCDVGVPSTLYVTIVGTGGFACMNGTYPVVFDPTAGGLCGGSPFGQWSYEDDTTCTNGLVLGFGCFYEMSPSPFCTPTNTPKCRSFGLSYRCKNGFVPGNAVYWDGPLVSGFSCTCDPFSWQATFSPQALSGGGCFVALGSETITFTVTP